MKTYCRSIVAFLVACCATVAAFAAEAGPTGTWKWTVQGRQGAGFEQTLTLNYADGKLTGVMAGRQAGQFSVPDTPISDASFKDGVVKFSITREFQGNKFTTKYEGKLEGDSIKGTFERAGANGAAPSKSDWDARRQK